MVVSCWINEQLSPTYSNIIFKSDSPSLLNPKICFQTIVSWHSQIIFHFENSIVFWLVSTKLCFHYLFYLGSVFHNHVLPKAIYISIKPWVKRWWKVKKQQINMVYCIFLWLRKWPIRTKSNSDGSSFWNLMGIGRHANCGGLSGSNVPSRLYAGRRSFSKITSLVGNHVKHFI